MDNTTISNSVDIIGRQKKEVETSYVEIEKAADRGDHNFEVVKEFVYLGSAVNQTNNNLCRNHSKDRSRKSMSLRPQQIASIKTPIAKLKDPNLPHTNPPSRHVWIRNMGVDS